MVAHTTHISSSDYCEECNRQFAKWQELIRNQEVRTVLVLEHYLYFYFLYSSHNYRANHRLPRDDICFQQDGAPAHYGQNVREHLYQVFHNNGLVGDVT
ncbi:hypothetical protein ANN_26909 [Periplaneta americana]|uniref:Uncharacterized protein n=1 Tax=Periplaneta americana TaxID=6978 RepID=A0ABQ8RWP7_PERAM|nr:hypothetical protein ANN_26909 [Periplaneta americana]